MLLISVPILSIGVGCMHYYTLTYMLQAFNIVVWMSNGKWYPLLCPFTNPTVVICSGVQNTAVLIARACCENCLLCGLCVDG